jgi:hypothetical protein
MKPITFVIAFLLISCIGFGQQQKAIPKTLPFVLNDIDVLCVARFKNKSHA